MSARRFGPAPIAVPPLLVALGIGLGVWQVERLHWKEGILRAIARAERAPPVPLGDPASPPGPFTRVLARGVLDPGRAVAYASDVRDLHGVPTFGVFLLEPLIRAGAPPVLMDLGWVPASPRGRPSITVAGPAAIEGFVRPPERPGLFTPPPDRAARQVFALDPSSVAAMVGPPGLAPYTVVALRRPGAPALPEAAPSLPRPPNNHFQYALTWFALALVAAVMSAAWWRQALRRPAP